MLEAVLSVFDINIFLLQIVLILLALGENNCTILFYVVM